MNDPANPNTAPANALRTLSWSNLAAQSAEQISLAAVPIVAVMLLQAGPGEIGLLTAAQTLPFLLLSIPMGVLADRWSRSRLMVVAEGVRALSLLALLLVVSGGSLSLAVLAVLGFIGAAGTVGFTVAAPALVPALVPQHALARANARLELARSAAFAAGPAVAGALVAWAGAGTAFVAATVLSTLAALLLLRLPASPRAAGPARHVLDELRHGAGLLWRDPLLRPVMWTAVVWNIAWFVLQAAYVPYAMRTLGLSADTVGFTLGCYGGGMLIGALLATRVTRVLPFGAAVLLGPLMSVLAAGAMLATLRWPTAWPAALSFVLFGAGPLVWTVTTTTLRQTLVPTRVLGQVSAMFLTVNAGARPLGAALGGVVGSLWGETACLVLAAVGFVLQALLISGSPVRVLRSLPAPVAP
ncbi:MAG TPA: MFS transporter [Burkholderiaceae bacterium]|nr:MFS transporter [Burkholderiaceae bacterium]